MHFLNILTHVMGLLWKGEVFLLLQEQGLMVADGWTLMSLLSDISREDLNLSEEDLHRLSISRIRTVAREEFILHLVVHRIRIAQHLDTYILVHWLLWSLTTDPSRVTVPALLFLPYDPRPPRWPDMGLRLMSLFIILNRNHKCLSGRCSSSSTPMGQVMATSHHSIKLSLL